jgi:hypothetical protein
MKNRTWTKMKNAREQVSIGLLWRMLLVGLVTASLAAPASAGYREQAKRIHDRLAGVPPTDEILQDMENALDPALPCDAGLTTSCDVRGAADIAMQNVNFYNVTLKNFAAPWTNRDQSVFVPLNDYIATVIGIVRDDVPFNTLLSADLIYHGRGGLPSAVDNTHYEQLEASNANLRDDLIFTTQSSIMNIPPDATAGIMTSRAASEAFFIAGTNRAMFRFTLLNHMCNDMEQVHDVNLSPDRIRQDVPRSPGGDSRLFLNNCVGCHTGMDPMAQAFAYYDFDEDTNRLEYTRPIVQSKYYNNDLNFPQGYRTPDDAWENRWREGQNSYLGFDETLDGYGNGAKSLGEELGNSAAFASCQVKKVFRTVCLRDAEDDVDRTKQNEITSAFTSNGYSLKQVFADSADYCKGP